MLGFDFAIVASDGTGNTLLGVDKTGKRIDGAPRLTRPCMKVQHLTGLGPILDHRVVTLHARIFGGILARLDQQAELRKLGWRWFDVVCVDVYALLAKVEKVKEDYREGKMSAIDALKAVLELMDIGGPSMIRGGAKTAVEERYVLVGGGHRARFLDHWSAGRPNDLQFRVELARDALVLMRDYDVPLIEFMNELLASGKLNN